MKTLPTTLANLGRAGLKSLEKCEDDPNYRINMNKWIYDTGDICEVCLAGSYLKQELSNILMSQSKQPVFYLYDLSNKYVNLANCLHLLVIGEVSEALTYLDHQPIEKIEYDLTEYHSNEGLFKVDFLEMLDDLDKKYDGFPIDWSIADDYMIL